MTAAASLPLPALIVFPLIVSQLEWPVPDGRARRIRILEVRYQPEAAGDLHL